jgi:glucokinase
MDSGRSGEVFLGVDIGGTRIRVGLVRGDGEIVARRESLIPPEGEPEPLRDAVAGHVAEVCQDGLGQATAAGVALPGVWDAATGVMQKAVNLPRLEGTCLPNLFAEAVGRRVRLEADVNAAAWGQYRRLDPRPIRMVYVSLGTGVGGSVVLDGEIMRHTRGGAGHFGFLIVDTSPNAPAGRNNVPGCLSAIAAGPALHLAATGQADNSAIGDEPLSSFVIEHAARGLAVALMNLVHIYAPDTIVLGGGVIDHHPEIAARTQVAFSTYQSSLIPDGFRIVRAPLTTHEAGVIGAALLASTD